MCLEFQMLFGFLWPFQALGFFSFLDMIAVTLQQPFGFTFRTPKVEHAYVTPYAKTFVSRSLAVRTDRAIH